MLSPEKGNMVGVSFTFAAYRDTEWMRGLLLTLAY